MKKLLRLFRIMLLGLVISSFFSSNVTKAIDLDEAYKIVNDYKYFGLNKEATIKDLTKARNKMALKWHPDKASKGENDKFTNEMKKINSTFDDLKDLMQSRPYVVKEAWEKYEKAGPAPTPPNPSVDSLQEAVKRADEYIEQAKKFLNTDKIIENFQLAIQKLQPFTPNTSAKIIKTYNELIKYLLELKELDKIDVQLMRAKVEQQRLEKEARNLPKFKEASQELMRLESSLFNALILSKPKLALDIALKNLNPKWVQQVIDAIDDSSFLFSKFFGISGENDPKAVEIIRIMLSKKNKPFININEQAPSGMTALMRASQQGSFATNQELLKSKDIVVNLPNAKKSQTALDYAIERNDQQIIKVLRGAGAQTYVELQKQPKLALDVALKTLNPKLVQQVIDAIDDSSFLFQKFFGISVENDSKAVEIIRIMLSKKNKPFININEQAPSGMSALMRASQQGSYAIIQEFLKSKGIDVNVQNKQKNKTALDYAIERKDQQIIKMLRDAGALTYMELQK